MLINKLKEILLLLFFILLPVDVSLGNIVGGMSLINYIMILYIILFLIQVLKRKKLYNMLNDKIQCLILILILLVIISLLFGFRNLNDILNESAFYTFILGATFYLTLTMKKYSEREMDLIEKGIYISIISLIFAYIYTKYLGYSYQGRFSICIGREYDPNYFSVGLNLILIVILNKIVQRKDKKALGIHIISLIFLVVLIIMSASRSAILSISISVIIYIILIYKKKIYKIIPIFLVGITILLIIYFVLKDYIPNEILDRIKIKNTIQDGGSLRVEYWKSAFKYINLNSGIFQIFFGFGFGSFLISTAYYLSLYSAAHNMYIQVLFELGIVGLIIFSLILFLNIKLVIKEKNAPMISLIIGLLIAGLTLDMNLTRYFWTILFLIKINFLNNNIRS